MGKTLAKLLYWKKKEEVVDVPKSLWEIQVEKITEYQEVYEPIKFQDLIDPNTKAILILNVSDSCNLTGVSFRQLNKLQELYGEKGLKIVAVPCLQYDASKTKELSLGKCGIRAEDAIRTKFKVEYPVLRSVEINGKGTCDLYKWLRANSVYFNKKIAGKKDKKDKECTANSFMCKQIPHNFSKFLLNRNGVVVDFFEPAYFPMKMQPAIEKLLSC